MAGDGQVQRPHRASADLAEDLDYKDKNIVVIGSGATAATIVPAMAPDARHVTMLQRSPTYFIPALNENELANILRELQIDESWIHEIVRRKILHDQAVFTRRSFSEPEAVKQELLAGVRAYLGPDYDIEKHFTPKLPAMAATDRLRTGRRPVPGHRRRQGLGRHRRD